LEKISTTRTIINVRGEKVQPELMGIDFGTGGCKVTVIDAVGSVMGSAYTEYATHYPHPGWSEQNPADWISALPKTVKACLEQCDDNGRGLAALSVTASTHNAVLTDKEGRIIRPCIMWTDQRSINQTAWLNKHFGEQIFFIGMQYPSPTWTLPQLLWIKENEPEAYKRIAKISFVKDYVRGYLTGDWCTDHVDAQGSLLYDARARAWSRDICAMIDLPLEVMPPIYKSKAVVGKVTRRAGELTGLPAGLPVVAGCSDTAAEDFGAGAVEPGQMVIKLATAGNINMVTREAQPHPKAFTYPHVVENVWYTALATNACASSYRWFRDTFFAEEQSQCEKNGKNVYRLMDDLAGQVPVGALGLIYHPYLLGERCPYYNSKLRANFVGMGMVHEKKHFARSVLEGVAYSLNDCYKIAQAMNPNIVDVRLIGGGAKSNLWCQIVSDVIGVPVLRPKNDDSSFGGALLAGVGEGVFRSEIEASKICVKVEKELQPNWDNHTRYCKFFEVYRDVVTSLESCYAKLYEYVTY
jgi:xylulokinase